MIDLNSHLYNKGFYQVGDEKIFSKFQAIMASQKTGHFPEWNFNNEAFGLHDWTVEPAESLWEIYRQRAQQIRDQYDYVILLYSGGSDSTNILQAFLFNNIPIDETFCFGAFSTDQHRSATTDSVATENMSREIDTVALPYLNQLAKDHKFKVTVHDYTSDIVNGYKDADWIWSEVGTRLYPSNPGKNRLFENSATAKAQLDAGKKVCFISGIDKPRIILKDGVFYFAFLDYFTSNGSGQKTLMDGKDWFVEELFYWTPDMPKLVIKQAHLMMRYFKEYPEKRYLVERADLGSWKHRHEYFELTKALMYPYWNRSAYQAVKPTKQTFIELDNWFINSDGKARQYWLEGVKEVQRIVDPYWLSQDHDPRFTGSWSKFYQIGTVT